MFPGEILRNCLRSLLTHHYVMDLQRFKWKNFSFFSMFITGPTHPRIGEIHKNEFFVKDPSETIYQTVARVSPSSFIDPGFLKNDINFFYYMCFYEKLEETHKNSSLFKKIKSCIQFSRHNTFERL